MQVSPDTIEDVLAFAYEYGTTPILTFWQEQGADYVTVRIDAQNEQGSLLTHYTEISDYQYEHKGTRQGMEYELPEVPFGILHAIADKHAEFRVFLVQELQP